MSDMFRIIDGVIVILNCNHKYHQVCIEDGLIEL